MTPEEAGGDDPQGERQRIADPTLQPEGWSAGWFTGEPMGPVEQILRQLPRQWIEYGALEYELRLQYPELFGRHIAEWGHVLLNPRRGPSALVQDRLTLDKYQRPDDDPHVTWPLERQARLRDLALEWIQRHTLDGTEPISRETLREGFVFDGERFPLVDAGRGIRKPAGWDAALTIMTTAAKPGRDHPYADEEGPDGLHRYKLRRDQRGSAENLGLRVAMQQQLPVIWLVGIAPGVFTAIAPTYLIAEEPDDDQFVLALSEAQRRVRLDSPVESVLRGYLLAETKRRLHQPVFANQVMRAYATRCAVCSLGHRRLLDAAHVIADSHPDGLPVVSNGLALCKIHHAAYDQNFLGIRPDYVVEIQHRLLDELDGPMLLHGLQEHHGLALRQIPRAKAERPAPERLEIRYAEFRSA